MTVLERQLKIQESFIHIDLDFEVLSEAEAMTISFSYSPKKIADKKYSTKLVEDGLRHCFPDRPIDYGYIKKCLPLSNLITFSLDAPNGEYVGDAHRQDSYRIYTISETQSSPGFIPFKIIKGKWRLKVSSFNAERGGVTVDVKVDIELSTAFKNERKIFVGEQKEPIDGQKVSINEQKLSASEQKVSVKKREITEEAK
jgi:hypothetical protein